MAISVDIRRFKYSKSCISIKKFLFTILFLLFSFEVSLTTTWSYQITGTFIQLFERINYPSLPIDWNINEWLEEVRCMKEIGIDTVIVQYSMYDNDAYYSSVYGKIVTSNDQIENILKVCDKEGLFVYLGLALDSQWWKGVWNTKFLDQLREKNIKVVKELISRYGKYRCMKGWYLPFEIEDRILLNPEKEKLLSRFVRDVVKDLKGLTPHLQIVLSPYFLGFVPPEILASKWAKLFKSAGVDIVAVQDGAGRRNHKVSNEKIYRYFKAFNEEFRENNIRLWVDMEIYTQTKDWPNWDAKPIDIKSIKDRLYILGPLVEKIICFEFTHYMSPRRGKEQKILFEEYRRLK
ncbi:DUF4434 domain-containing protein [bacterium]|nr:DUF4434 domain-containing protein [bacterium]